MNCSHIERRADGGAFRARAVVAADVDDQRVVELAHVFDLLNHPTNFMVGVSHVGGKDIRLTNEELLFVGAERFPFR